MYKIPETTRALVVNTSQEFQTHPTVVIRTFPESCLVIISIDFTAC